MKYALMNNSRMRAKTSNRSRRGAGFTPRTELGVGELEERVVEKNTFKVSCSTTGQLSSAPVVGGDPAGLLISSRLTGYQALRDDCRIDKVVFDFVPLYSGTVCGEACFYLERQVSDPVVGTLELACDQFEATHAVFGRSQSITWLPQQPSDRVFQSLNPGTTQLFLLYGVANSDGLGSNGAPFTGVREVYTVTVTTWMTLRGRP
jgi:hypothetical protein